MTAVEEWKSKGYCAFPGWLDKSAASALLAKVKAQRAFDQSLFLTEEAFNAGERTHRHTNPRAGRNILEQYEGELDFVYKNPQLNALLAQVLGQDFKWYLKKMVCRIPEPLIPEWVFAGTQGSVTNTLGAFMHPEYRDISYYYENDLHQDIIDYPRLPLEMRDHRYITLFVDLLEDEGNYVAPSLLPGTHMLGATLFQHDVRHEGGGAWMYRDDRGHMMPTSMVDVEGGLGYGAIWHSCLVHGARALRPVPKGKMHLSLRFLLTQGTGACAMEEVNAAIDGPLFIAEDYTPGPKANTQGFVKLERSDFLQGNW